MAGQRRHKGQGESLLWITECTKSQNRSCDIHTTTPAHDFDRILVVLPHLWPVSMWVTLVSILSGEHAGCQAELHAESLLHQWYDRLLSEQVYYYDSQTQKARWKLPKNAQLPDLELQDSLSRKALLLVRIIKLEEDDTKRKLDAMKNEQQNTKKCETVQDNEDPIDDLVFEGVDIDNMSTPPPGQLPSAHDEKAQPVLVPCLHSIADQCSKNNGWGGAVQPYHRDNFMQWATNFIRHCFELHGSRQMASPHNLVRERLLACGVLNCTRLRLMPRLLYESVCGHDCL